MNWLLTLLVWFFGLFGWAMPVGFTFIDQIPAGMR